MVVHAYNLKTGKAEAGASIQVSGQSELIREKKNGKERNR